ncbi:ATP-dependent endonuclease [uncultured Tateyamaria sp.]|uniref:ATP-dependent nuclease n=1 Tax=uncultured Tateyamaria sp. TaxID=455651 RepID=UPI002609F1DC|nr:AAA family ATPase [uncultured Tateyamaria sp.]
MKLREVGAKNFRTLEDLTVEFVDNFCTLSGRNNAGKTAVVTIIRHFLDDEDRPYLHGENQLSFARDHTQWSSTEEMEMSVRLELHRHDDAEVFFVVEKFATLPIEGDVARVRLTERFSKDGESSLVCRVNGTDLDSQNSSEIAKKLKSAANLVVHNSTAPSRRLYYFSGEMTEVLESHFSQEDRKKISDAERNLSNKVKNAAKQHKEELSQLLGRLGENYDVELTTLDRGGSSRFPLNVKLNDKSVDANLGGWGSGTQNRTRVLISVLEADRIRKSQASENRSTPVVIVEEPESFLHPSAQAEFGKVLNNLAEDFGIQILATTHSPYMLNQRVPEANLLLERKVSRKKLKETERVDTSGDDWMLPFADNLGVTSDEFIPWKKIVGSANSRIVLVEGAIDVEYFSIIKTKFPEIYGLPDDVEVVGYGGKDALKNTQVLQFMLSRLDRVFITFDLDAKSEVVRKLESIELAADKDFCAVGLDKPGRECIEGLLPETIMAQVYNECVDDVMALGSANGAARKSAKSNLKQAALRKFETSTLTSADLPEMAKLIKKIAKAF